MPWETKGRVTRRSWARGMEHESLLSGGAVEHAVWEEGAWVGAVEPCWSPRRGGATPEMDRDKYGDARSGGVLRGSGLSTGDSMTSDAL